MALEQRYGQRAPIDCPLTLVRRRGGPVAGHTEDVGPGGARIVADRPLSIDEELDFDLVLGDVTVSGRARVLREQAAQRYALRFEQLDPAGANLLAAAAKRAT